MELEKQRMEFTKEVEFERLDMFIDAQLELTKTSFERDKFASSSGLLNEILEFAFLFFWYWVLFSWAAAVLVSFILVGFLIDSLCYFFDFVFPWFKLFHLYWR